MLTDKKTGEFTILINNNYLLIAKNNSLKNIFSIIYSFALSLTKNIQKNENFILNNIKEILSLINLILIFNDNVTFYSLKKKILLLLLKNEQNNLDEIILNEYYFTCTKNKKCRKSLISWDYKYFIYERFQSNIHLPKENNKTFSILNMLKDELNMIEIKEDTFYQNEYILNDLAIINEVNIIQSRNYHMWTYLRKVFDNENKEGKILIILYAFVILRKCSFDYSAFSFIVNMKNKNPLTKEQLKTLIDNLKKSCIIKYDEHKCYIDDIDKFILN
jgi:fumarate reductase subunit C